MGRFALVQTVRGFVWIIAPLPHAFVHDDGIVNQQVQVVHSQVIGDERQELPLDEVERAQFVERQYEWDPVP